MRKNCLLGIFLFISSLLSAQVIQVGKVVEHNSIGKGIPQAEIIVLSSSDLQPVVSDNNGMFFLKFSEKKIGDVLRGFRVTKTGFEIVNNQVVRDGWVLTDMDTLVIVMAPEGKIAEARARYYDILDQYQVKKYRATVESLKSKLEKQQISTEEYARRANDAEVALCNAYARLDEFADKFARVNKDDMDSITKEAFEAFDRGDVEGAITVYENHDLLDKLKNKVQIRDESQQSIDYLSSILLKEAELLQLVGGKNNFELADSIYTSIALTDTTNFGNMSSFLDFLVAQKHYDRAMEVGELLLRNTSNTNNKSDVCQKLGHIFYEQKKYAESELYLKQSLELAKKYVSDSVTLYLKDISSPLNTLGNLYYDDGQLDKAEEAFLEALKLESKLIENDSSYYIGYTVVLTNLGDFYQNKKQYKTAMNYLFMALPIREKLASKYPKLYSAQYANILNTIGKTYCEMNNYDSAGYYYSMAIDVIENVYKDNPDYYNKVYIIALNNFGHLNQKLDNWDVAESYYKKAIELCEEASKNNPELYNYYSAAIMNNMGTFYRRVNRLDEAEQYHLQALKLRSDMLSYSDNYKSDYSQSCYNLGRVYWNMKRMDEAEKLLEVAYENYHEFFIVNPMVFSSSFVQIGTNVARFYKDINHVRKAKKCYKEVLKCYQQMEVINPGRFTEKMEEIRVELKNIKK